MVAGAPYLFSDGPLKRERSSTAQAGPWAWGSYLPALRGDAQLAAQKEEGLRGHTDALQLPHAVRVHRARPLELWTLIGREPQSNVALLRLPATISHIR